MIVSANIAIYAVPAPQPVTYADVICQPEAVPVDCNNVQSLPLRVKVVKRVGGALEEQKAYVRIRVFAGEAELGATDSGGKVSEWEYYLPADKWGNADLLAVEVYGKADYTDLLAEKKVGILRQNAVPFPIEGEWKPLPFKYKNGEYFIDPVHNQVFQWGNPVPGNSEMHPFEDMKQHPQETSWRKYSDWALLATQVFLANWAKLGSAVFSGDYMMSQHGRNIAGEADSDYRKFDAEKLGQPDCPFTPNIMVDWLKGKMIGLDMDMRGGRVGSFEVRSGINLHNVDNSDCWISIERLSDDGESRRVSSLGNNVPSMAGFDVAGDYEATGPGRNTSLRLYAKGSTSVKAFSPTGSVENYALDAYGGVDWKREENDYWSMPGLLGVLYCNVWHDGNTPRVRFRHLWGDGIPSINGATSGFNMEHRLGTIRFSQKKKGFYSVAAQKLGPGYNNNWTAYWNTNIIIESQDSSGFVFSCWYNQDKYYPGEVNFFIFGNPG